MRGRDYIKSSMGETELTPEVEIIVPTMLDNVVSYALEGQYLQICALAPKIIDLMEKSHVETEPFGRSTLPYTSFLGYYGVSLGAVGNFEEGERMLEKALSVARSMDNLHSLASVEMLSGIFSFFKGDAPRQVKHYGLCLEYMEMGQVLLFQGIVKGWLGMAYMMMDQPDNALKHLDEGLRIHTDSGLSFFQGSLHIGFSETHLALGNLERARLHGEQAVTLTQKNNERFFEAGARMSLGRAIGASGPEYFEEAQEHILSGIRIFAKSHVRPREAVGYLYLAELQANVDRKAKSLENLKKAESMFQAMGMDYWLGKAREALARL